MSELKGACIIGQSGGPTSVINASAYGVIRTALDSGCITNVYGAEHGIKGVLEDRLFDMSQEDPKELELLKYPLLRPRLLPLQDEGPRRGRHRLQAHP